jgi:choline dehydrogenase-like flavoprotein
MESMAEQFDVPVIGSGPAGCVCAIRAAQPGKKTAIVGRAVFHDGKIETPKMMTATMSCDHRLIDCATGAHSWPSASKWPRLRLHGCPE